MAGTSRVVSIELLGIDRYSPVLLKAGATSKIVADESAAAFDASTSKIGGAFSKLGSIGASFGLPFASSVSTLGTSLDQTSVKAASFGSTLSTVGGVEAIAAGVAFLAVMMIVYLLVAAKHL